MLCAACHVEVAHRIDLSVWIVIYGERRSIFILEHVYPLVQLPHILRKLLWLVGHVIPNVRHVVGVVLTVRPALMLACC